MRFEKILKFILRPASVLFIVSIIIAIASGEEGLIADISSIVIIVSGVIILFIVVYFVLKNGFAKTFQFLKYLVKKLRNEPLIIVNLVAVLIITSFMYRIDQRVANIENRFGGKEKLKCSEEEVQRLMNERVVRIIGSYGEGSGFPISEDAIITSFHVVDGESSPKVVFPDGSIESPERITGSKLKDIAIINVKRKLKPLDFYGWYGNLSSNPKPSFGEPVYSAGYPFGHQFPGEVTISKGSYSGERWLEEFNMNTIQTDISINRGMSGGPLINSCGQVIGVNTSGVAGLSIFVDMRSVQDSLGDFTADEVTKLEIDTDTPEGVVQAFYAYIKARDLESAFELISGGRRSTISSFEEWIKGYAFTLHVNLIMSKVDEDDENMVHIRIESQDWLSGKMVFKYFEGTWEVIEENGKLKLNESSITQIEEPDFYWFSYWELPDWAE